MLRVTYNYGSESDGVSILATKPWLRKGNFQLHYSKNDHGKFGPHLGLVSANRNKKNVLFPEIGRKFKPSDSNSTIYI